MRLARNFVVVMQAGPLPDVFWLGNVGKTSAPASYWQDQLCEIRATSRPAIVPFWICLSVISSVAA